MTSNVIFGSGNLNGSFTGETFGNLELALRGKLRYDAGGHPQNTFNYDGVNTYTFLSGNAPANKSIFNWEWSINTDVSGLGGDKLNDFTYVMSLDNDPTAGINFYMNFDPVNVACADNALGDSTTGNGAGLVVNCLSNPGDYGVQIGNWSLAQNFWNQGFFGPALGDGLFTYSLAAYRNGDLVGSTMINVQVGAVPLPATLPLLAFALGGVGFVARRRKTA